MGKWFSTRRPIKIQNKHAKSGLKMKWRVIMKIMFMILMKIIFIILNLEGFT